jgi:hypothetical protein
VLPALAILVFVLGVGATLAVAGETLGYDFLAYHAAASRVLDGQPAYDTSYQAAGGFGLFYYPPTFLPLVLAVGLLSPAAATWAWTGLLLVAFLAGTAILPVHRRVRWLTILLAGQSWPFLFAIKLGQVGPLLFLLFAAGWRWMDRPRVLGLVAALGAAIKLQPAVILLWAFMTRRFAAFLAGGVVLVVLAALATLIGGARAWSDFLLLVGRVSDPITTPRNVTVGAVAWQLGLPADLAAALQWLSLVVMLGLLVVAALRLDPVPSYLVAVVASQLLSPILWDHYAMLLLLPVAWMVDKGRWWAAILPLTTSVLLLGNIPPWVYPLGFVAALIGVYGIAINRGKGVLTVPVAA